MGSPASVEAYDAEYGPQHNLWNNLREHLDRLYRVTSLIHRLAPKSILDLGCNEGIFGTLARWNHQPLKHIVGVDFSTVAGQKALANGYDEVHVKPVEDLDLHRTFDLVLCMEVLEHVSNPGKVIDVAVQHTERWLLLTTPLEGGPVDGSFHIRHVSPRELVTWLPSNMQLLECGVWPSEFCEKPQWLGWTYLLAERRA